MSKPFFIWTMRRTGGTSLTTLLTDISEFNNVQHEPFNTDRQFGRFIQDFRNAKEHQEIASELDAVLVDTPLIKHCYEIFGKEFNKLILESTVKQDYKHIFLKREDEISRIVSLFLAQQTSVWGPEQKKKKYDDIISGKSELVSFNIENMVKHYKWCQNITRKIQTELIENGKGFKSISFEDFYVGDRDDRLKNLYDLFDYLEFNSDVSQVYKNLIEEKIFNSSQNSQDVLEYVPNYKEAISVLSRLD